MMGAWMGARQARGMRIGGVGARSSGEWSAALGLVLLSLTLAPPASAALPPPTYDNTLYGFVYMPSISSQAEFDDAADELLDRVLPGKYAKIGFVDYFALEMPWTTDLEHPVLERPSPSLMTQLLDWAKARGLVFHMSVMGGMSRAVSTYDAARKADRRNAQWFADGLIGKPDAGVKRSVAEAWVTPSRYARKLRRHLEVKVRAFAQRFLEYQAAYPDTLISASGDAEAELSDVRRDDSKSYDEQIVADYSPFAILEFRDWLLHTGLYADDGPYAGEGYRRKRNQSFQQGASALTPENLAAFNAVFGTSFTSWNLEYFHWSLDDPIDGDPHKIGLAKFRKATWSPMPTSGSSYVPGGFDAPRSALDPGKKFWKLWLQFRTTMMAHYSRDFAIWMTTTLGPGGTTLSPNRWYSHQIPADYLNGRSPASTPELRLITSASPLKTAIVGADVGSPGLTVLDRFEYAGYGPTGGYNRTSQHLFDAMVARGVTNWGIPEFAPSWPIDVLPDTDVARIAAQYRRAYDAGAHMFCFTPWPHFVDTANGDAVGRFFSEVRHQPRPTLP